MRPIRRAASTLLAATAALALAAPAAAQESPCAGLPGVDDRCETWSAIYDDPTTTYGSHQLEPRLAGSADGRRLFVSTINQRKNQADPAASPAAWTVLGYDGASGAKRWETTYQGPGDYDRPNAITASRDGSLVVATGGTYDASVLVATDRDLTTIAYDGQTGRERWRSVVTGPVKDLGTAVLLSPDESQVFVMVNDNVGSGDIDGGVAAYDAVTGEILWRADYAGLGLGKVDSPKAIALSPSGDLLYLAVESGGRAEFDADYAVVAYATGGPQPGRQVWEARWDAGNERSDRVSSLAVDVDGRVVVTGDSLRGATNQLDYATVALDGTDGHLLWVARYAGSTGTGQHVGRAVAASPTARVVVVSGQSQDAAGDNDWATLAYDSATGAPLWTKRLTTPRATTELANEIAFTRDGASVLIAGVSGGGNPTNYRDFNRSLGITTSYAAGDGTLQWTARLTGDDETDSFSPRALLVADDGSTYTAGQLTNNVQTDESDNVYDAMLVAYRADPGAEPVVPEGQPWLLALVGLAFLGTTLRVASSRRLGAEV